MINLAKAIQLTQELRNASFIPIKFGERMTIEEALDIENYYEVTVAEAAKVATKILRLDAEVSFIAASMVTSHWNESAKWSQQILSHTESPEPTLV